jgi:hypothetical protein
MARVNLDFLPTIADIISDDAGVKKLVERLNVIISRLNEILRFLTTAVNTVEFGDGTSGENVFCNWVAVQFGTAGVELTATHSLAKEPRAIIGSRLNLPGAIYFSTTPTSASLYLKSDTDSLSGTIVVV